MKLEPNKKYKVVDDDLINGYQVLTGKQLNSLLEKQDSLLTLLHSVKSNYLDYLTNDILFKTIYKKFPNYF